MAVELALEFGIDEGDGCGAARRRRLQRQHGGAGPARSLCGASVTTFVFVGSWIVVI